MASQVNLAKWRGLCDFIYLFTVFVSDTEVLESLSVFQSYGPFLLAIYDFFILLETDYLQKCAPKSA